MIHGHPLVSVILPTFNRAALLGEAVESALTQTYSHLEVIVVDDGSTDKTADLLAELAANDARVRPVTQTNGGVSSARNHALSLADGDYIAYLDSDDIWLPWKVESQLNVLQACPEVGMVWTDMDAIGPSGDIVHRKFLREMYSAYNGLGEDPLFPQSRRLADCWETSPEDLKDATVDVGTIYSQMFFGNLVHTPTVMLTRERALQTGPFDEAMRRGGEDYKYHLATCRLGPVAFIDMASILYRTGGEDRITHPLNQVNYARSYLQTIDEEFELHRDAVKLNDSQIRQVYAEAHCWLSEALFESGDRIHSRVHALQVLKSTNRSLRAWKLLLKTALPASVVGSVRGIKSRLRSRSIDSVRAVPAATIAEHSSVNVPAVR